MEHILISSSPALTFCSKATYQLEVCVIGWIHQEVDYNMQPLVFVEAQDHLERLRLKEKVEGVSGSTNLA